MLGDQAFQLDCVGGVSYIVVPFESLELIESLIQTTTVLSEAQLIILLQDISALLQYLHERDVFHAKVTTQSVFFRETQDGVLHFALSEPAILPTQDMAFLSSENTVSQSSDLWSLGCVVLDLLHVLPKNPPYCSSIPWGQILDLVPTTMPVIRKLLSIVLSARQLRTTAILASECSMLTSSRGNFLPDEFGLLVGEVIEAKESSIFVSFHEKKCEIILNTKTTSRGPWEKSHEIYESPMQCFEPDTVFCCYIKELGHTAELNLFLTKLAAATPGWHTNNWHMDYTDHTVVKYMANMVTGESQIAEAAQFIQDIKQGDMVYAFGKLVQRNGQFVLHNVHMNQGSIGRFVVENRRWEDGCIFSSRQSSNSPILWRGILLAFSTQFFPNDRSGNCLWEISLPLELYISSQKTVPLASCTFVKFL